MFFLVRLAYHAEWEAQFGRLLNLGQGPGAMNPHPLWEAIWKLRVPRKVKIFVWRVMQNFLPCKVTLASRHVKTSAQCPVCNEGPEDIKHLLFSCHRAKKVLKNLEFDLKVDEACSLDRVGRTVLEYMLFSQQAIVPAISKRQLHRRQSRREAAGLNPY